MADNSYTDIMEKIIWKSPGHDMPDRMEIYS